MHGCKMFGASSLMKAPLMNVLLLNNRSHLSAAWLDTGCHLAPVIYCERRELLWPMQKALS